MLSFAKVEEETLIENKDKIITLLKKLLTEDAKFMKAISQRTSDTANINYRINTWFKELKNAVPF